VPLLDEAVSLLGQYLPIMDVAEILGAECGILDGKGPELQGATVADLEVHTRSYLARTTPLLARPDGSAQQTFLLVPASKAACVVVDNVDPRKLTFPSVVVE